MTIEKQLSRAAVLLALLCLPSASSLASPSGQGLRLASVYSTGNRDFRCRDQQATEVFSTGAALLSAIIGPVVTTGIKGLGAALSKAGADVSAEVSGTAASSFYAIFGDNELRTIRPNSTGCVLLAAGVGAGNGPTPELKGAEVYDWRKLGFSGAPSFAMVAAVELSNDGTAWRLVPYSLYIGRSLTKGGGFRSNQSDMVLQVSLYGAAAKSADDAAVATRSIVIGRQSDAKLAVLKSSDEIEYLGTSWMPLPPVPAPIVAEINAANQRRTDRDNLKNQAAAAEKTIMEAKTPVDRAAAVKIKAEAEHQIAKLNILIAEDDKRIGGYSGVGPFSLNFRLVETRDGSKFLQGFGALLVDNAETIAKPVADAISPVARQAAADAKLQKALTAVGTETDARVAAIEGIAAWQGAVAAGKPASEIAVLKLKAGAACRKLELSGFAQVDCLDLR